MQIVFHKEVSNRYFPMILHLLHRQFSSTASSRARDCSNVNWIATADAWLFSRRWPLMLKGSFDAQLIFLSELNMRFDVTACACDLDQYPNSIYNTTDHFFLFSHAIR